MRIDSTVFDRILFVVGRNHPSYVFGCAFVGKILTIHDDIGNTVYMGYSVRAQRSFQVCYIFIQIIMPPEHCSGVK